MYAVSSQRRRLERQHTKPEAYVAEAAVALASLKTPARNAAIPDGSTRNVRRPESPQQITVPANVYQRTQREAAKVTARHLARAWLLNQQSPDAGLQDLAARVGRALATRYYAEGLAAVQAELREQELLGIVNGLAYEYMLYGKSAQEPLQKYRAWLGDEKVDLAWAGAIARILKASGQARRDAD